MLISVDETLNLRFFVIMFDLWKNGVGKRLLCHVGNKQRLFKLQLSERFFQSLETFLNFPDEHDVALVVVSRNRLFLYRLSHFLIPSFFG